MQGSIFSLFEFEVVQNFFSITLIMASQSLVYFLSFVVVTVATVNCNQEGDALIAWKNNLADPYNVLQSWDPTLVNPCTWFHVKCNSNTSVILVDLGNAGLSGPLVPELGYLSNLHYLGVYNNSINGSIPNELGNLTNLVGLDLKDNQLSGSIPATLGNLRSLRSLRLNNNNLTGTVPTGVMSLIFYGNLNLLNVANNSLAGTAHDKNPTGYVITTIVQDPKSL